MTHGFGRIPLKDERDKVHLFSLVSEILPERPKRMMWYLPERLDQGSKPHCVGFSWKGFLLSKPNRRSASDPLTIYNRAQILDMIPGENYPGTTVRGGAAFLQKEAGLIKSYRWAFTLKDALDACGLIGPVVLGTDWYDDMLKPDGEHKIHARGDIVGGHAYLLLGYNDNTHYALIHNSWGEGWGNRGRALLSYENLDRLIRSNGEACIAMETEI